MHPKLIKIFRWPENKKTGLVPWFVILRRLIFWPILFIGMCICYVAILGGFGLQSANNFWKDV